ncbi:hypothetical protein LEP1GSC193_1324 [Leptospira alstonii serovar Pingchang str. 80-412]|uniref:Uncharacterized protein n=1 Tax=Leptospira alstonii serovar Pingchang str. 80-412 TaxID=1218564 RepID=T0H496_9LEPT|nr:hypothetical protein LEP1GSC193_1324 [Leptospira alstonii serovar Pingchang str. 80-412]
MTKENRIFESGSVCEVFFEALSPRKLGEKGWWDGKSMCVGSFRRKLKSRT